MSLSKTVPHYHVKTLQRGMILKSPTPAGVYLLQLLKNQWDFNAMLGGEIQNYVESEMLSTLGPALSSRCCLWGISEESILYSELVESQ